MRERLRAHLSRLYPDAASDLDELTDRVLDAIGLDREPVATTRTCRAWAADDAVLITYPDSLLTPGEAPLATLRRFVREHLHDVVSAVHVLPFFPWSSDDGFSVIDHQAVDPAYGGWSDIEGLATDRELMVDIVLNHVSASSDWYAQFLAGEPPGVDYVLTADPSDDLSSVTRPRATPLLRQVDTALGPRHVWCTFSADQVDVDWSNPDVLVEYLRIIDGQLCRGARLLRLDAVAYAWKRPGTTCIHLPEVHELVRMLRTLVSVRAPDAVLIAETNVPSAENLSYLGDGDEAHVVYAFPLAPLLVDAVLSGDGSVLSAWLAGHPPLPPGCAMFTFLATHDGIGVRPVEGLLAPERIDALCAAAEASGGSWSPYATPDGPRPYELNVSLFDLLGFERFVCAHTLLLALAGIPALYLHSLLATPGAHDLVAHTGRARSINRPRLARSAIDAALAHPVPDLVPGTDGGRAGGVRDPVPGTGGVWDPVPGVRDPVPGTDGGVWDPVPGTGGVFSELSRRIRLRRGRDEFAPDAPQEVLDAGSGVVAVRRGGTLVALHNVTDRAQTVSTEGGFDVLSDETVSAGVLTLEPHQCRWLV